MNARFEKICKGDDDGLSKLEDLLAAALPKSAHLLVLCRIARKNLIPPEVDVQFYRFSNVHPSEENKWWEEKDPFIVCIQGPNLHTRKGIIMFTPVSPSPEMIQTFDSFIGWSKSQVFQCLPPPLWSSVEKMCKIHQNAKPENNAGIPGIMLAILNVDEAKRLGSSLPVGAQVRSVEDGDVEVMVNQWKWRAETSEQIMRKCIKTLTSCALFVDGELASSVVQSPLGVFNVLYTAERHRRKGYGKIVMESISQQTAALQQIPPMAEVEVWNDASRLLLEKLGYEEVFKTKWFYYDPPIPTPTSLA